MGKYSDILFTADFDRTLTAPDSTIPQRNLEAIDYFMENGGAFTVNTGRSVPMTKAFRDIVPLSAPLLLYNGSAAYDPNTDKMLFCHEIQMDVWETVHKCHQWFPELMVEIQGVKAHYRFRENPGWDAFCTHNQCTHAFAQPGEEIGPFLKFSIYGEFRDVTVAGMFQGTPEEVLRMNQAEKKLREEFGEVCEVFRAAPRIVDVHAKGISKARSARELQTQMGRKILVCAGDADNDLAMLNDADFSFVPADSYLAEQFPSVCACTDGAVADVIYKKIPEILEKQG